MTSEITSAIDAIKWYYDDKVRNINAIPFAGNTGLDDIVMLRSDGEDKRITILRIILEMTLIYQIAMFEAMVKEYVACYFRANPMSIESGVAVDNEEKKADSKSLAYNEILQLGTYDEVFNLILDKELYKLGRKDIDKIDTFLQKKLKCQSLKKNIDGWAELRNGYYLRNLLVHNHGIVNKELFRKIEWSAVKTQVTVGQTIQIQPDDVFGVSKALVDLNEYIHKVLSDQLKD